MLVWLDVVVIVRFLSVLTVKAVFETGLKRSTLGWSA